ncbi:TRAP transporter small permease subunit [Agaribacter flavus]|uniref:TRAP transporter small permease protein n=1 Tax=Agaribacter flavus TaxID=1902781 RepID=A0ABV7FRF1_9ALTE
MSSFASIIVFINRQLGAFVSFATIVMAIVMFVIVLLRYGFNVGWIGLQESVTYLHAAVFLLGAAFTYQHDGHVRVDVFYRRFNARKRAVVDFFGALLFMLPVSVYLFVVCIDYVFESWRLMEASREPGGLPFVYILKSFMLLFAGSMALQAIAELINQGNKIVNKRVEAY